MIPLTRMTSTAGLGLLLAALLAVAGSCAAAETLSLLDGRCTIEVPEGWRAEQSYGDAGAALHPPDPRVWPIEIVLWPIPKGAPETPRAAAMAHEAAVARLYPYTRSAATEMQRADGTRALQVVGLVQPPDQDIVSSVFQAFAGAGYYCVVGTFCLPDQVDRTLAVSLAPVAGGVRLAAQPGPATTPAPIHPIVTPLDDNGTGGGNNSKPPGATGPTTPTTPVTPPGDVAPPSVGPATPVVTPQADTGPTTPTPAPGASLVPLAADGIKLDAPLDYAVETAGEWWLVRPRGAQRHSAGLLVWPMVVENPTWSPAQVAEEALRRWPSSAGVDFDIRPMDDGGGAFFASTEQSAARNLHIVGTLSVVGDDALLTALYVARDLAPDTGPMLRQMLASLVVDPMGFGRPVVDEETELWQVPKRPEVSVPIPKGWRARGAITKRLGYWAISLEAIDPGPERRYVSWQQPIVPLFRELTTLLEGIGYKEFDQYASDAGGESYTLYRRPTPQSFLLGYWNPETRLSLENPQIVEQTQPPELSHLISADRADTLLATVRGGSMLGVRENVCAIALGKADVAGIHNWQAAVLEAGGPAGDTRALQALRTMLGGLRVEGAPDGLDDGFHSLVAGAKRAAELLPVPEAPAATDLQSVLPLRGADGARRWQSPSVADWWRSPAAAAALMRAAPGDQAQP